MWSVRLALVVLEASPGKVFVKRACFVHLLQPEKAKSSKIHTKIKPRKPNQTQG